MDFESILELTDSEKIKLYIKRYKESSEREKREVRHTRKKVSSKQFTVLLSSGLDAVIEKDAKGIKQQFIFMPSQDKYFIKSGEMVQDIKSTKYQDFIIFFQELEKDCIIVNNIVIDKLALSDIGCLYEMIKNCSQELHNGTMSLSLYASDVCFEREYYGKIKGNKIKGNTLDRIESVTDRDKLWKMITTKTPILTNQEKYDRIFVNNVISIYQKKGYDVARSFVESYTKSSMKSIDNSCRYNYNYRRYASYNMHDIGSLFDYGLEAKKLIDYLCFGLYAQGFRNIPIGLYRDYLGMAQLVDGKVKDKYPTALSTIHDIMSLKYSLNQKDLDEKRFMANYEIFEKNMNIENRKNVFCDKDRIVILPEKSQDLINEGVNLGHCVGSYVSSVADGECIIAFVRYIDDIDHSYLTVELRSINEYGKENYCIAQIQGDNKRTNLTQDEIRFFEAFMKKTDFKTSNCNFTK